jgi:sugar/nucleoside kinase (ribokinase family)
MQLEQFRPERILSLASGLLDQVTYVPHLPTPGGDVLATKSFNRVGGALNLEATAARLGMKVDHCTPLGQGPRADLIREAISIAGVQALGVEDYTTGDSGLCITLVEPNGQRSFVTQSGAEGIRSFDELKQYDYSEDSWLIVYGYELVYPTSKDAFEELFASGLVKSKIVFDPGPTTAQLSDEVLSWLGQNASLISCNQSEYLRLSEFVSKDCWLLLRKGSEGAELHHQGRVVAVALGRRVPVVDTNGAGDIHTGAFLAALAIGNGLQESLELASRAAEFSIQKEGGCSGPTWDELLAIR